MTKIGELLCSSTPPTIFSVESILILYRKKVGPTSDRRPRIIAGTFQATRSSGAFLPTYLARLEAQNVMAPVTTAGLDLQNLSSNWKKLQEILSADTSRPPKRKAALLQSSQYNDKRQKLEQSPQNASATPTKVKPQMGSSWSSSEKTAAPSATLALWAEDNDISTKDLHEAYGTSLKSTTIPNLHADEEVINEGLSAGALASTGKYVAIDCEMVGVGPTPKVDSALARVSVVDYHGHQLYDSFVKTKETVTDYRTDISGITPALWLDGRSLETVQSDVGRLLDGRILVGHSIRHDLDAIMLSHPRRDIRDTSRHPAFRSLAAGRTPALKKLAKEVLGVDIQGGRHSSIEDARATMLLFRREKEGFEKEHLSRWGPDRRTNQKAKTQVDKRTKQKKKRKNKKK